jgi:hypothetical protein
MDLRKETIKTEGGKPLLDAFQLLGVSWRKEIPAYSSLDLSNVMYRVNHDLCDKFWEAIDLAGRINFCQATHVLRRVVYELRDIEEKTDLGWHFQLRNE